MTARWAYLEQPPPEQRPTIRATRVRFDEVRTQLPAHTRVVTASERHERIRIRQLHVQRRFSQA
jgi:hypothetical protein